MIEKYKRITLENDIALLTQRLVYANLRETRTLQNKLKEKKRMN